MIDRNNFQYFSGSKITDLIKEEILEKIQLPSDIMRH